MRRREGKTPGQLILIAFKRNKLAVFGLYSLLFMILFSFVGPFLSPYGEYEMFYRTEINSSVYITTDHSIVALSSSDGRVLWTLSTNETITRQLIVEMDGNIYLTLGDQTVLKLEPSKGKELSRMSLDDFHGASISPYQGELTLSKELMVEVKDGVATAITTETSTKKWEEPIEESDSATVTFGPVYVKTVDEKASPTLKHPLGLDSKGTDLLTRLMVGGRVSLAVGIIVTLFHLLIGMIVGGLSGYYGKWVDGILMRFVDVFNCIPTIPVILIFSSMMVTIGAGSRQRVVVLILVISLLGWPGIARLIRGQILSLREQEFMLAAEAIGLKPFRKITRHLLPSVMPQLIIMATLGIGNLILTESALSFLGLGLTYPYASWGNMVDAVKDPMTLKYHMNIWVPPGLCILLTVLSLNLIGDGLRDAFDPKVKGRRRS